MSTILVADDNSNIQKMVALALKDEGIAVVSVGNGDAAVRKLSEVRPNLILADIFMPVRSGYEVCEFVKRDERFAHIPVVLLVGAFDPLDEREAQRVGADGVLKKPFVPPEPLISMVRSLLAKSASGHPEPLVPVAAGPAGHLAERGTRQTSGPTTADQSEESPLEEFSVYPSRLTFGEGGKPVVFGELLQTPTDTEPSAESEVTTFSGAAISETKLWGSPAAAEDTQKVEPIPPSTKESLPQPEEAEVFKPVEFAAQELARPTREEMPAPLDAASSPTELAGTFVQRQEGAQAPSTWANASPSIPTPFGEEATPPAETQALPSEPAFEAPIPAWLHAEPAAAETPQSEPESTSVETSLPSAMNWPDIAQEAVGKNPAWPSAFTSPVEPAEPLPAAFPAEPAHPETPAVHSFSVPQPADAETVDAVVEKVLERMQPEFMEIITREILKPVVEALVRRELEKH